MWESIISGAGSLLGGIFGLGAQSSANETNKELADYAYQKSVEMWNRQNAYNTPSSQMERLRAAGLNPNLVYGSGVTGNTSSGAPDYKAPNVSAVTSGGFVSDAVQKGLWTKAQLDNLQQQTELSKSQQQVSEQNIAKIGAETAKILTERARSRFELGLARELRQNSIDVANANLDKIRLSNEGQEVMNAYNRARTSLIPLQKKLTERQIDQIAVATAQAKWDLDNEYAGRIPKGMDFKTWFMNQVLRGRSDLSSIFTGKNRVSVDEIWDFIKGIF